MDFTSMVLGGLVASAIWWAVLYWVMRSAVEGGTQNLVKQTGLVLRQNELAAKYLSAQTELLTKLLEESQRR